MTDLDFLTAMELSPLIKSRQLSPVELTKRRLTPFFIPTLRHYLI